MSGKPRIDVPESTRRAQRSAADPARSVWVSANAGSGKTWVLSERVIRLLLAGTDPSRILCLTYTKAAAAEMSNRVFSRLGAWTLLPDAELDKALEAMEGRPATPDLRARARRLFARALETPGGLAIRTIHAFCESLLHRFPLEANIPGHFELMDERMSASLIAEARTAMLGGIGDDPGDAAAFADVIGTAGEQGLDSLIHEIVAHRTRLIRLLRLLGPAPERARAYREAFGSPADGDMATIAMTAWPLQALPPDLLRDVRDHASRSKGSGKAFELGHALLEAGQESDPQARLGLLVPLVTTAKGDASKIRSTATKAMTERFPDLADRLELAQAQILDTRNSLSLARQVELTLAALTVADRLISGYETLKRRRGLLDFDDVIERTVNLLMRDRGGWVQYKLDQGIDHILVDEAQDTAPAQWRVIEALSDEFFAGEGARPGPRTLFAVGDEKQSIYSFQGADPAGFGAAGLRTRQRAGEAFSQVALTLSFRSTDDVLKAVETVFSVSDHRRGLDFSGDGFPVHQSNRQNQPGRVELWPMEVAVAQPEPEDWTQAIDIETAPEVVTANRIASTIAGWLRSGELLEGQGRPVRPGDIIVLVRRRDRFIHALSRALKNAEVPVAGADRLRLTDHIAIKDLVAVGRFVLQPADDLSLAALLKSPLFGFDEDALFAVAHGRGHESLYATLRSGAQSNGMHAAMVEQLTEWRNRADRMPVFEFYAALLGADGGRAKLLARLGPEAADMLDEFLNLALAHETGGLPGLESFLAAVTMESPDIKREMDGARNEVRIMTVHASKGLEAPVVFLVDNGSKASSHAHASVLPETDVVLPDSGNPPARAVLWAAGSPRNPVMDRVKEVRTRRDEEEYRRLLYVAMTRAADRLIIAGYATVTGGKDGVWYRMIEASLAPLCETIAYPGFDARRYSLGARPVRTADDKPAGDPDIPVETPPPFLRERLAPEPPRPRPLAPSGVTLTVDPSRHSNGLQTASPLTDASNPAGPGRARLRGAAIHTLLQVLPDLPPEDRETRARDWLRRFDTSLAGPETEATWRSVSGVLSDPRFAALFAPGSRAEVPVLGTVRIGGRERAVSGVIDRIAATGDRVLVVDYKTDRQPPLSADGAPPEHVAQLALYRALLAPLYPERTIVTALLYTETPALIEVPSALLDVALHRLAIA